MKFYKIFIISFIILLFSVSGVFASVNDIGIVSENTYSSNNLTVDTEVNYDKHIFESDESSECSSVDGCVKKYDDSITDIMESSVSKNCVNDIDLMGGTEYELNSNSNNLLYSTQDSELLSDQSTNVFFNITEIWYGKSTNNNTISGNVTSGSVLINGGNIILKIDDDEYQPVNVVNGWWSVVIDNTKYAPGNHSMTATYTGYGDYSTSSLLENLTVLTSESSGTTFTDLQNYINSALNGDTLYLSHNYSAESGRTVTINKNLTINGNNVTLNALNRCRILYITADNVTLNNITFEKGQVGDYNVGAGILWQGNFGTLNNCVFNNNILGHNHVNGGDQYGGAISWNGNFGNLNNCVFNNNRASGLRSSAAAIDLKGNVITLNNCNFTNHDATGSYSWVATMRSIGYNNSIINCYFANNKDSARFHDGILQSTGNNFSIINCTFYKNEYSQLNLVNNGLVFINNTFIENHASGQGLISTAGMSIINSSFVKNRGAGAVVGTNSYNAISILNCTFEENYIYSVKNVASIIKSVFNANSGTSIYSNQNNFLEISKCNFTNNKNVVVHLDSNSNSTIFNCNFTGNKATDGAALYLGGNNLLTLDCNFEKNIASRYGGAIYVKGTNSTFINCTFTENNATNDGGAFCSDGVGTLINNCTFTKCYSNNFGGAVCVNGGKKAEMNVTILNSKFYNNAAKSFAGAVVIYQYIIDSIIKNCIFDGNSGKNNGGALWIPSGEVINCNFTKNYVNGIGGAIHHNLVPANSKNYISVNNCNFVDNSAFGSGSNGFGGAISSAGSSLNVSECNFINNSASEVGGAIYTTAATNVINNSIFSHNKEKATSSVKNNGVIISVDLKTSSNVHYSRILTKSNSAAVTFNNITYWNGTDFINSDDHSPITEGIVGENITLKIINSNNEVIGTMHGLTNGKGVVEFDYVDLCQSNSLKFSVCHDDSDYYYANMTFNDNVGDFTRLQNIINYYGSNSVINLTRNYTYSPTLDKDIKSGILIKDDNVIINANGFTIDAQGKSTIFNVQGNNVKLNGIKFKNGYSESVNGGAVNWQGVDGILFNCSFSNNYAKGNGDSVYWAGSNGKLYNCTFYNNIFNYGAYNGGIVYWQGADGTLYDCTFRDNSFNNENSLVSLIYSKGNNFILNNCDFSNNNMGSIQVNNCLNVTVVNCNFTKNSRKNNGVCIYVDSVNNINVINSSFNNNSITSQTNGGIIYINGGNNFELINSTFTNNSAINAGAVYINGAGKIYNCNFTGNKAQSNGGALYVSDTCVVDNCNFINNTASYAGGAVYLALNNNVFISNSNFNENYVSSNGGKGGAIFVFSGSVNISNSSFKHNKEFAKFKEINNNGVIISIQLNVISDIHYSRIVSKTDSSNVYLNNVTYWNGTDVINSDVYIPSTRGIVGENITLNIFDENNNLIKTISDFTDENGTIMFDYIDMSQHKGLKFSICHDDSDYYYDNVTFNDNMGDFNRLQSIIDYYGSNSVINLLRNYTYTINLDNNIVDGIIINCTNVTIDANGHTINALNKSRIFNISADNVELKNISFKNGLNNDGGAIIWNGDNGSISNALFSNNVAKVNGGSIYSNSQLNISNTKFYNNTAYSGSALYVTGVVNMDNVEFIDNLANVSNILLKFNQVGRNVTANFTLNVLDNFVNAIYASNSAVISYSNITYFEDGKIKVSDDANRIARNIYESDNIPFIHNGAFGENLTVNIFDGDELVLDYTINTNSVGNISLELYRLLLGNTHYKFNVVHNRNNYYSYYEVNDTFFVQKADPQLIISGSIIDYGNVAYLQVSIIDDAKGMIVIKINDTVNKTFYDTNGVFNVSFEDVNIGMYQVVVTYSGDGNYSESSSSSMLFVDRPATKLNITVEDIYIGDDVLFNFTLKSFLTNQSLNDASGILRLIVGGKQYNVTISEGKCTLSVSDLSIDKYDVIAIYSGDINYKGCDGSTTFEVKGYETDLNIEVIPDLIRVGDSFNVTVKVNDTINNEPIYLYVDGELCGIALINKGIVNFTVSDLKAGDHKINAAYNDNGFFASTSNNTDITILKHDSNIVAEAVCDDENNVSIIIKLPSDAIGNITIQCNDSTQLIIVPVDDLVIIGIKDPNTYNFNVTYLGDDKYFSSTVNTIVNVGKISNYNMALNTTVIVSGRNTTIFANLPSTFEGLVNFTINGVSYDNKVVNNGVAFVEINVNNTWSRINVTAVYSGFDKYDGKTVNDVFFVVPIDDYEIRIDVADSWAGDDLVINITAPDEISNVTIVVEGINDTVYLVNGVGNYTVYNVHKGVYVVNVYYQGDDTYYVAKSFNKSFNVYLINANVTFNENMFDVVSDSILNITSNLNDRNITVYLEGNYYDLAFVNENVLSINLGKLAAGNHSIILKYDGDEIYTSLFTTHIIEVFKLNSSVNISAGSVRTGNPVVIDVNASGNGVACIVIYNENISFEYNVTVNDGKGSLVVPADKLVNGSYLVNVTYLGDDIYYASSTSTGFTVIDRVNSTLEFDVPVFVVNVANDIDVTGNFPNGLIDVYLDGKKLDNVEIKENRGVIRLAGLNAGNHTVIVYYAGDYDHAPVTESFDIFVEKLNANISVNAPETTWGGDVDINVDVLGNETGYIMYCIKNKNYTVLINDKTANIHLSGLDYGINNITIIYSGDNQYYNLTTYKQLFVDLKVSPCDIEVQDVFVGHDVKIVVKVDSDATGNVSITVNNETHTGKIADARVEFIISNLNVGNYTVSALYHGDKYYMESFNNNSFLVKSNNTIHAEVINRGYNSGEDYNAAFTDGLGNPLANATVTFSVDGVDYNLTTDENGIASLNISLGIGNHTIVLYNPVTGAETHSSVNIAKPLIENKDIVTDYNSGYLYKVRVIGVDGKPVGAGVKFTIPINYKSYTYYTDKNGYITIKIDKRFTPSKTNNKLVYKIKLSYRGYTVQNTITIMKTLKTKKIVKVKKSAKKLVLSATLKSSNGKAIKNKKITFKFNGKVYKAKTNSKGIAKITINKKVIKKLKAGKNYKVKITYLTDSVKSWVKVRK